ncbi:MAG: phosphomannomutase, partial [bacterium]|nr:phosphomannomutase [bacterium]
EARADLGFAFDGDGDRFAVVDEQGVYHDANQTLVLLARDILSRHPGTPVVYTVSCSGIVPAEIKALGGVPHMVPVGHSFVEQAMGQTGALIGGEQSGHFFVAEKYYGFDDAAYAAAKLLKIFSQSDQPVSSFYAVLPKVHDRPERRPACPDEGKFELIAKMAQELSSEYECNTLDGVRVEFGEGAWLGIRASNTSPCLSVIMEARSQEQLAKIEEIAFRLLKRYDVHLEYSQ